MATMDFMHPILPDIWLLLIGFFLLYYAVTDGADLGVGIWSLFSPQQEERQTLMTSVGSIWHGNQTWLVILGGMLFGAFPKFYSILLSALYIPIIIMLFGLILRGVSFEFLENSERKKSWRLIFGLGSLIVTLAQGFALGGLLGGLEIREGRFVGSAWGWFSPYGAFIAVGVASGYLMLGSNYLIARTTGLLQSKFYRLAAISGLVTLLVSIGVHTWTMVRYPQMAQKWTTDAPWPLFLLTTAATGAFLLYFLSLKQGRHLAPLLLNAAIIVLSFSGLSFGLYPDMIPGVITSPLTVWEAAASEKTLSFMLVITAFILPVILFYTGYNYWVFSGKTDQSYRGADST